MTKTSKIFGFVSLGGAVLFLAGVVAAIALFERGAYSPVSGFVTELGQYKNGYLSVSSALYFNIGIVVFGLTFGLLMVWRGSLGDTALQAAVGFTGALAGVLAAAQGIFTLNFSQYHYIVVAAFYFAAFLFCALQLALWLKEDQHEKFGLLLLILFFVAGALCLVSGVFTVLGGFARVLKEDISGAGRLLVVPFAVIGWLSVAVVWVCDILLSVGVVLRPVQSEAVMRPDKPRKNRNDFAL